MKWRPIVIGLIFSSACISIPASAKGQHRHGGSWYAEVGATYNHFDLSESFLNSQSWVAQDPAETSVDNNSLGYSVHVGRQIIRYLALDLAYSDFGSAHYHLGTRLAYQPSTSSFCGSVITCPAPSSYGPSDYTYHASILRLVVKGSLPIHDRWTIDARAGIGTERWRVSDNAASSNSDSELATVFGFGTSFAITPQVRLHLDWERYGPFGSGYGSYAPTSTIATQPGALYETVRSESLALSVEYRL